MRKTGGDRTEQARRTRAGDRADRHGEAAELFAEARRAAGLTCKEVAAACAVSETLVYGWEDPDSGKSVPLGDAMNPATECAVVRLLAKRAGMVAVSLPSVDGVHDDLAAAFDLQRETSEAVTTHLHAISDGVITRQENAAVRAEIDQAIEALVRVKLSLEATAHEPCTGVRRAGVSH